MRRSEKARGLRRYHPAHRVVRHLDNVHGDTGGPRHRGELEADKAGPDHDHLARLSQPLAQYVGVGQSAQRQHAVELGARHGERPKARSGGEDEMVAGDLATGSQSQTTPGPVDRRHGFAGHEVDLLLLVECLGPQQQLVEPTFAGEIRFRQGRALVGQHRLVADQHDAAGETLLPQ